MIRVAIVTGKHGYDVPALHVMFRSLDGLDCYPQHMEDFCSSPESARAGYRVLVFFNMHLSTPTGVEQAAGESTKASRHEARVDLSTKETIESLGRAGQGLFVWHHALLAYPDWPHWSRLCGMADRRFDDVTLDRVSTHVAHPDHPITHGLRDWEMDDELYLMKSPDAGTRPLLTTEHAKSMNVLAWTHRLLESPVVCYQSGHNRIAYENPSFRQVMRRAILWLAGEL